MEREEEEKEKENENKMKLISQMTEPEREGKMEGQNGTGRSGHIEWGRNRE